MTWLSDASGRHQERWHDGTGFTARVRDHGIENDDPIGADRPLAPPGIGASSPTSYVVSPGLPAATPTASVPIASVTPSPVAAASSSFGGPATPLAGPPTSFTPPAVAVSSSTSGSHEGGRRLDGIPASLALATIIAACPMLIALVIGAYALMAGVAANNASDDLYRSADSYEYSSPSDDPFAFTSADRRQLGGGLGDLGDASTNSGLVMVAVGCVGLLLALGMARGSKPALFFTALWMIGGVIWMLVQLADSQPSGAEWIVVAPLLAPPVIALLALCTSSSQAVFQTR